MTWFDASTVEPSSGTTQFPVGRHPVVIRSSAQQAVKDKPNEGMLILQLEVIDGPAKGLVGPYRLNLWNSSPQASEIAHKQLSAICHVTGRHQLTDKVNMCSEMFAIPFVIAVSAQADARYTQIDGVVDMAGNPPKRGQVPQQPAQQPPQQQAPQGQPSSWQAPQGQPATPPQQPPQGQPSWGQQPPATHPPAQAAPSWGGAPQQAANPPQQQAPQGQPSWAGAPAGAQPSWGR